MVVKCDGHTIELKNLVFQHDHEGADYVEDAEVYLDGENIGDYNEDYMGGDASLNIVKKDYIPLLNNIAKKYFAKYPTGAFKYDFEVSRLYPQMPIEGVVAEMSLMGWYEKYELVNILNQGFPYAVLYKKMMNGRVLSRGVIDDKKLKECRLNCLVICEASKDSKENFVFNV
jgi:hypothetical protein